jgi:hypothetical protein
MMPGRAAKTAIKPGSALNSETEAHFLLFDKGI